MIYSYFPRLRVERDNAVQLVKQLEFQEKELSTEDSQTCLELRKDVKRRDREKKSLLSRNKDLEEQLAALQNELRSVRFAAENNRYQYFSP